MLIGFTLIILLVASPTTSMLRVNMISGYNDTTIFQRVMAQPFDKNDSTPLEDQDNSTVALAEETTNEEEKNDTTSSEGIKMCKKDCVKIERNDPSTNEEDNSNSTAPVEDLPESVTNSVATDILNKSNTNNKGAKSIIAAFDSILHVDPNRVQILLPSGYLEESSPQGCFMNQDPKQIGFKQALLNCQIEKNSKLLPPSMDIGSIAAGGVTGIGGHGGGKGTQGGCSHVGGGPSDSLHSEKAPLTFEDLQSNPHGYSNEEIDRRAAQLTEEQAEALAQEIIDAQSEKERADSEKIDDQTEEIITEIYEHVIVELFHSHGLTFLSFLLKSTPAYRTIPNAQEFSCAVALEFLSHCEKVGASDPDCARLLGCSGGDPVGPVSNKNQGEDKCNDGVEVQGNSEKIKLLVCDTTIHDYGPGQEPCIITGLTGEITTYIASGDTYDPCNDTLALTTGEDCGSIQDHVKASYLKINSGLPDAKKQMLEECEKLPLGSTCAIMVSLTSPSPKPPTGPSVNKLDNLDEDLGSAAAKGVYGTAPSGPKCPNVGGHGCISPRNESTSGQILNEESISKGTSGTAPPGPECEKGGGPGCSAQPGIN